MVPMGSRTAVSRRSGGDAADAELARLAKALAHPVRVRMLRHLAEQAGLLPRLTGG